MTNKKITDLVELTTPTTDDVFPLVDIATNSTKKAQLANLPISTATQTAIDAKQATLVSGTNIKTINSTSLLGSGNISIAANPAGTAGQIQFNSGSAFAADSNLFWDNTNKVLNVGYGNDGKITLKGTAQVAEFTGGRQVRIGSGGGNPIFIEPSGGSGVGINFVSPNPSAMLQVKGSGSTSATNCLLLQNSSGTELLKVQDNGDFFMDNGNIWRAYGYSYAQLNSGASSFLVGNSYSFLIGTPFHFGSGAPDASAHLQLTSTTKGFLPPRMTTTQKNAISTPAAGLMVYDTTTNKLCCYNGTTWNDLF